ncbi:sigma-70 family RNA polymerase sigma factor [Bacillus sp. 1780r2a1]|nr:sigma-70 family RNA polymerase sigma factor [Bacillus sp. 1780r2a1]
MNLDKESKLWNDLAALCSSYSTEALKEANKIIKDEFLAMDIVQDSIVKVLENLHSYDETRPFWPWYKTIVKRIACNMFNKKKREIPKDSIEDTKFSQIDPFKDSNTHLINEEFWKVIKISLTEKQYLMIFHRYKGSMEYQQIAECLDVAVGTVKRGLFDSHRKLKTVFNKNP